MGTRQVVRVEQLRSALTDALERLVKKDRAQLGFVVVEQPDVRYLQFSTDPESGGLLFDEGGFTGVYRPPPFVTKPVPDPFRAATIAEVQIRSYSGWSLSSEDKVTIVEDDCESRWRGLLRKVKEQLTEALMPEPVETP